MEKGKKSLAEKRKEESKLRYHPRSKSEKINPPKPKPDYGDKSIINPNKP